MNRTLHSLLLLVIVVSLLSSSVAAAETASTASGASKESSKNVAAKSKKSSKASDNLSSDSTNDDSKENDAADSQVSGGFGQLQLQSPFAQSLSAGSEPSGEVEPQEEVQVTEVQEVSQSPDEGEDSSAASSSASSPSSNGATSTSSTASKPSDKEVAKVEEENFEPLPDVEESVLELILPGKINPRVEFNGYLRLRSALDVNYDLDTEGTSAVLPILDSTGGLPASKDKRVAISTNMRLHIKPVLWISDELSIHSEFDLLDNVILGSHPERLVVKDALRPELYRELTTNKQFSVSDAIKINQLYGQVDSLFGSLYAGRMDNHFGLGIQNNNGECLDCNYGSNVDSVKVATRLFGLTGSASIDFPDEGITTSQVGSVGGQGYDLAQVDDVDQYTFSVLYAPYTDKEKLLQERKLKAEGKPVANAGFLYRYRSQDGVYSLSPQQTQNFPLVLPPLIYKGLKVHTFDIWGKLLYNPNNDLFLRLEAEGFVNVGGVDNVSSQSVGGASSSQPAVNCFDGKPGEKDRCTKDAAGNNLKRQFVQWGVALESEVRLGQLASWGLNLGLASGGDTPNWGISGKLPDYNFARFNRDYQIDLILFRNIIGTVTNAAYFKPYVHFEFLKYGNRHIEADVSSIFSLAINKNGTPSGETLLGSEFDAAIRYILKEQLNATIEGGVLFPLSGLAAKKGRPRYLRADSHSGDFTKDKSPSIAWTLQGKLSWLF